MRAKKRFLSLLIVASLALTSLRSEEKHVHMEDKKASADLPHDEHDTKSEHEADKEGKHDEHDEENSAVGPNKGIVEFHAEKGFRLSPEAMKNFGITLKDVVSSQAGFEVPVGALLEAQDGKYVYAQKSGLLKRIPVEVQKKTANTIFIKSSGLSLEDKVVTSGVAFLRGAELDVTTGGGSHGH